MKPSARPPIVRMIGYGIVERRASAMSGIAQKSRTTTVEIWAISYSTPIRADRTLQWISKMKVVARLG
jgi:hypothetical protein